MVKIDKRWILKIDELGVRLLIVKSRYYCQNNPGPKIFRRGRTAASRSGFRVRLGVTRPKSGRWPLSTGTVTVTENNSV